MRVAQIAGARGEVRQEHQRLLALGPGRARGAAVHREQLPRRFRPEPQAEELDRGQEVRVAQERASAQRRAGAQHRGDAGSLDLLDGAQPLRVELGQPSPREKAVVGERPRLDQPDQIGPGSLA